MIANVLIGNIEKPGGLYFNKNASYYNKLAGEKFAPELKKLKVPAHTKSQFPRINGIDTPDGEFSLISARRGIYQSVLDASIDANPYQLRGWFMTRTNPVITMSDTNRVIKAMK